MGFTNAYAHAILNGLDDGPAYLALFTVTPSDSSAGTEVAGAGYARQAITLKSAAGRATSNDGDITFGPAGANWGTVNAVAIMPTNSGGTARWWDTVNTPRDVLNGESATVKDGELDITIDAS